MRAIKYKISISESSLAHLHGFSEVIDEIAIDYLGAIINHTGVHFPEHFDERITSGNDAEEIDVSSEILNLVEGIKTAKEAEQKILNKFNLRK